MIKPLALASIVLLGLAAMAQAPSAPSDEALIRETISKYLHGLKFNDVESLKQAFLPDAKLFFVKKTGVWDNLRKLSGTKASKRAQGKRRKGTSQLHQSM